MNAEDILGQVLNMEPDFDSACTLHNIKSDLIIQAMKIYAMAYHSEKSKWIDIKERLPEIGEIILALSNNVVRYCKFMDGQFRRQTENSGNDRIITFYWNNVTHWQPLPAIK